ncbi:E3 ubiquitin-protein ligase RNF180 isoform 2-T2 [Lycodopsis pacificus]
MLRCRRCRKGVIDSTCLSTVEATDESSAAVCSIWHVNVDTLPEWILTSVHQAQWTVGKLNCQNCGARLGGFNFVNRSECPCGRNASVHLNKSRVDRDHKHCVLIVQPRRTRPETERAGLLTDGSQNREQRPELNRTALDSLQLNCAAVMSHISAAEASNSLTEGESTQSFSFSPLYCISHRRRCSLEDDSAIRSSCFCPAGLTVKSAVESAMTGTHESTESPVSYPTSQQFDTDDDVPVNAVACRSFISRRPWSPLDRPLLQTVEDVDSSPEAAAAQQELPVSALFHRGRSVSDSVAEQDQDVVPRRFMASAASNRLSKREKNRLKSLRRKQRRRERWLHSQLEQSSTKQPRPSSRKCTTPASRTSRMLRVQNGLCPAVANASVPSGVRKRLLQLRGGAGTLLREVSRWMLWTSPTCAAGSSTSARSSSTSTQSTGSWRSSSSVSSCTTTSVETPRRAREFREQVYRLFFFF